MKNNAVFVVGTGTDVGKTYVSAVLVNTLKNRGINVGYYKPVSSGNERINGKLIAADAEFVKRFANLEEDSADMISFAFEESASPHFASRRDRNFVNLDVIKKDFESKCGKYEFVIVEGCGGIICPLMLENKMEIWQEDLIATLDLPVIVVADSNLGAINATCLTISYLKSKSMNILGIILNNFDRENKIHQDNCNVIMRKTGINIIENIAENQCILIDDSAISDIIHLIKNVTVSQHLY